LHDVVALGLILLLATAGYGAGRLHGQFGYRVGFRFGYRQGYFDGDRASWNRRRRDLQAAVASVLKGSSDEPGVGTTYTSAARDESAEDPPEPPTVTGGRHARADYGSGRWSATEIRQRRARTLTAGSENSDR
jgi:hypothetical protein